MEGIDIKYQEKGIMKLKLEFPQISIFSLIFL